MHFDRQVHLSRSIALLALIRLLEGRDESGHPHFIIIIMVIFKCYFSGELIALS